MFSPDEVKVQKRFFNPEIAATLTTKLPIEDGYVSLIRSMHLVEYRHQSSMLNFRYGMYNPEYPNILKNNSFALDFDYFTVEAIESSDSIIQFIDNGHKSIQKLFETAITEALRKVMNNV